MSASTSSVSCFEIPGHDGVRRHVAAHPPRFGAQHVEVVQFSQHVLHRPQAGHERRRPHQPQLAGQLERVAQPLGGDADRVYAIDDQDGAGVGHRDPEIAGAIDDTPGEAPALAARQAAVTASGRQIAIAHQIGEAGQQTPRPPRIAGLAQVLEGPATPLRQMGPQHHDRR